MPRKKKGEPQAVPPQEATAPAAVLEPQAMTVRVSTLREALELVAPAVPRKTGALPITSHVQLGEGRVVATNLEVAVAVRLPEAQGDMLLPHKDTLAFLKYVPGHLSAEISARPQGTSIVAGNTRATFPAQNPRDFPPVPLAAPDGMEHQGVLDGDDLVKALAAVLLYASTDQARPVLTGICLTLGEEIKVAAGDGYRVAWEGVPGRLPGEGHIILPPGAILALEHLWKRAAAPDLSHASTPAAIAMAKRLIRMGWNKQRIQMDFGRVTLVSQLIDGTFPNYEQLIPTEHSSSVIVDAEDMLRALHQVARAASAGSGIVRQVWQNGSLRISAVAQDVADTTVSLRATSTAPGRTAINHSYLTGYFSGKEGEVTMSPSTPSGPVTFSYRDTPHVVMMPMFVQWGDEPAAQAEAEAPPEQVDETEEDGGQEEAE